MILRCAVGALAVVWAQAGLAQTAATPESIYAEAAADCAASDNGVFSPGDAPVSAVDLTGDGAPEQIVNWAGFSCSTLASPYGGTGGSPVSVLVAGQRFDWTVLDYQVLPQGGQAPVVLLAEHGGECGGSGSDPCYEAVVWNGERFLSVRPEGGGE